jgi:hypothetical protein
MIPATCETELWSDASSGKNQTLSEKQIKAKRAGSMAPSKCEALNSNPSVAKKLKQRSSRTFIKINTMIETIFVCF